MQAVAFVLAFSCFLAADSLRICTAQRQPECSPERSWSLCSLVKLGLEVQPRVPELRYSGLRQPLILGVLSRSFQSFVLGL